MPTGSPGSTAVRCVSTRLRPRSPWRLVSSVEASPVSNVAERDLARRFERGRVVGHWLLWRCGGRPGTVAGPGLGGGGVAGESGKRSREADRQQGAGDAGLQAAPELRDQHPKPPACSSRTATMSAKISISASAIKPGFSGRAVSLS